MTRVPRGPRACGRSRPAQRAQRTCRTGGSRCNVRSYRAPRACDRTRRGAASRTALAFVARAARVSKIRTARALQKISRDRRHVANLRRRAREDRLREQRVSRSHIGVKSDRRVRRERADAVVPARRAFDRSERELREIDDHLRTLDALLHQIDERRSACEIARAALAARSHGRRLRRPRAPREGIHHVAFRPSCTARTMFGYAPHRQMLPLIASRTSSSVCARFSDASPTALMICPGVQKPH